MATKLQSVGSLQKGSYVLLEGAACRVSDTQVSRPGKHGHAKVRMTAVGIVDGKKRVVVMPGHDSIEVPIIEKKIAQVLKCSAKPWPLGVNSMVSKIFLWPKARWILLQHYGDAVMIAKYLKLNNLTPMP